MAQLTNHLPEHVIEIGGFLRDLTRSDYVRRRPP